MARDDYSSLPGINFSTLKELRRSPAHYRWALDNQDAGDTASRMGLRLIHSLILEPDTVQDEYMVTEMRRDVLERRASLLDADPDTLSTVPQKAACLLLDGYTVDDFDVCDARRGTKAWKEAERYAELMVIKPAELEQAEVLAEEAREAMRARGKTVVSPVQMQAAEAVRDALFERLPFVEWVLSQPETQLERKLSWADPLTGLRCKGIADIVLPGAVVDLKTVRTTELGQLVRDIVRMGYHIQGAHYCAGVEAVYGLEPGSVRFGILAVEGTAPHDAAMVWLSHDGMMYSGETERRALLLKAAECLESGHYPGRHPEPVEADVPDWLLADDEDNNEDEQES